MAYNAVQVEEVASDSESDLSSPSHSPFPRAHDHAAPDFTTMSFESGVAQLGTIYHSMTSSSYEMVEADDYDADPSPDDRRRMPPLNTAVARHSSPDPPLRSASTDSPVPLSHPTPDLQSIQGAYMGNVERLEQSAERLSSSTQDIASEIRKMDQEQKRRSCSSASNSIIMRNDAFPPGASLPRSSHGSTRSTRQRSVSGGSRLAQVAEPEHDDSHYLHQLPDTLPTALAPQLPIYTPSTERFYIPYDAPENHGTVQEIERPDTAASGDTFQQARTLFTDFDGVHFTPLDRGDSRRRLSLTQPPLASKPHAYKRPQAGENMVYYPAPVPRMLNLPPKLSRKPPVADREKRRTQILTSIAAEDRKIAFGEQEQLSGDGQKNKRQSALPPQLRASVFFDPPSTTLELEVKQDSAVATLDSILDASAHAPVSAFTDHPYAGHVGSYVYGQGHKNAAKPKIEHRSQSPMGQYPSTNRGTESDGSVHSASLLHSGESERPHTHRQRDDDSEASYTEGEESSSESEEEDDESTDYVGPPNTLLAELELRKQELQQRRRTVLPKPTEGMQTTLLEMDEMAQKQSEKRRRRPVTLAWDSRRAADDDDVPLAMLYPDQVIGDGDRRPQGLMEKHHLDENEPLSARRARLRGEPVPEKRPVTVYVDAPSPVEKPSSDDENGEEGAETLAERLRRLRGQNPTESEFSHNLLAEFDNRFGDPKESESASKSAQSEKPVQPPNEEETLAQRRARLQREAGGQQSVTKNPRVRQSMAALPQVRPNTVYRSKSSYDILNAGPIEQPGKRMSMQPVMQPIPGLAPTQNYPMQGQPAGYPLQARHSMAFSQQPPPPYSYGSVYPPPPYAYNNTMVAMHQMGYPMPAAWGATTMRQPIDPAQRDVIDRWRQSIR